MMNRRSFLRSLSLAGLGLAAIPELQLLAEQGVESEDFSLKIITDDVARALAMLEAPLARSLAANKNLRYSEVPLVGPHLADVVLFKNRRKLDYRNSADELAQSVCEVAKLLGLPKKVENPVLMKFYTEDRRLTSKTISIFGNNVLITRLSLTESQDTPQIESAEGRLSLVIRNKSADTATATCRHKTCMSTGPVNSPGKNLEGHPSRIRIAMERRDESGFDGITY
jgi:hypothetical protein